MEFWCPECNVVAEDGWIRVAANDENIRCLRCHGVFHVSIVSNMSIKKEINTIKLGQKVKDKVTGFSGITTGKIEYLNGCVQFCVKPEMTEPGKMPEGQWIDDMQLEVIGEGLSIPQESDGGPMPDTPGDHYVG